MKTRSRNHRTLARIVLILALVTTLILPGVQAADGDLDTTFNAPNGFVVMPNTAFGDIAIQPDGKILAVGVRAMLGGGLIVVRFNSDGTLDSGFGTGGIATATASGFTDGDAIALQSDGKIVAAGGRVPAGDFDFFVTRFNTDGSVDTSFGQSGSQTIDIGTGDSLFSVVIGPAGSILLVGEGSAHSESRVEMARLDSSGNLDATFGVGGKVATEPGRGRDAAFLADGRILVAGQVEGAPTNFDFGLWRYNSNGSLDLTFGGGDGIANADFAMDSASALAVQTDGRIVLAGAEDNGSGALGALARFDSGGILDPSFGSGGKVISNPVADISAFADVTVLSDGRILAVGSAITSGVSHPLLSRFTSSGSPDPSFGIGGNVISNVPEFAGTRRLAIQSDGKIVIGGTIVLPGTLSGWVARYKLSGAPPPPPPPSFNFCVDKGSFIFKLNSTTGAYEFRDCAKGFMLTGTGTITVNSCKIDLLDTGPNPNHPDRNVQVRVNPCTKVGTVTLTTNSPAKAYGYTDNDITTGTCVCP